MKPKIEIVIEDEAGARIAAEEGADSIELCVDLDCGGLTPPLALMQAVGRAVREANPTTEYHVLILNKPSHFFPTLDDIAALKEGIQHAAQSGATGVVFGALDQNGMPDDAVLAELISCAGPMKTTFHRAFDQVAQKQDALERLIALGFSRLLTSGGQGLAADHTASIQKLVSQAAGRCAILAGGGIRANNLEKIARDARPDFLHMSCREPHPTPPNIKITSRTLVQEIMNVHARL